MSILYLERLDMSNAHISKRITILSTPAGVTSLQVSVQLYLFMY
jgi:hypothetical protein